jgi:hypothetical protein
MYNVQRVLFRMIIGDFNLFRRTDLIHNDNARGNISYIKRLKGGTTVASGLIPDSESDGRIWNVSAQITRF